MKPASDLQHHIAALFTDPALPPGYPVFVDAPPPTGTAGSGGKPESAGFAPPDRPARKEPGRTRTKLWDLEAKFHCPVVGTCVQIAVLARLAKRFGLSADPRDDYALHVEAVGLAGTRNAFSEALQRHLDQTYEHTVRSFADVRDEGELAQRWQAHFRRGQVAGAFWAVLGHKAATADVRQQAYRDLHMLSHQVGAGQAADARRLAEVERELATLRETQAADQRRAQDTEATLRAQVHALTARNVALHAESAQLPELRRRLSALENGEAMIALAQHLMRVQHSHDRLQARLERAELAARAAVQVTSERDDLARRVATLERLVAQERVSGAPTPDNAESAECATCEAAAASSNAPPATPPERCVLCVGGRTTLLPQYRSLAERLGFRLIHHDGGQEEALARLPDMIHAADAVLCPTDCVSHSAYYRLKRQCKRDGKRCVLFRGASVSGFAMALTRLAAEPAGKPPIDAPA